MSSTLLLGLLAEVHLTCGRPEAARRALAAAEAEVEATGERFFAAGLRDVAERIP
jgi:hypothetical protein